MDEFEPQGRRRKGSLRKTVLLGVERLRLDRRPSTDDSSTPTSPKSPPKSPPKKHLKSPTKFAFELPSANSSTESHDLTPTPDKAPPAPSDPEPSTSTATTSTTSPTSPTGPYTTTTTDDDEAPLQMPPPSSLNHALLQPLQSRPSASPSPPSSDTSSVLAPTSPPRARLRAASTAAKKALGAQSPLDGAAALSPPPPLPPIEEEWDYAETAWWGWVILIVTWVVFVVGMGSCLEVWSWAWDVGQTPYAPPELEDDPTLPIVGYYPALFVLTAVMSWVWVMVAWVGLKYFKHAKFQGEDT